MGHWDVNINSNDTAEDCILEFKAILGHYGISQGIALLDQYFLSVLNEDEQKEYIYALADFLWSKGCLPDWVKERTLDTIKNDPLTLYEAEGKKLKKERRKILDKFVLKITSPMKAERKISWKPLKPFLNVGDIFTLRLPHSHKYIVVQYIYESISFQSAIDPALKDSYGYFLLLDYESDALPTQDDIKNMQAVFYPYQSCTYFLDGKKPMAHFEKKRIPYIFFSDWKKTPFKKREISILGNYPILFEMQEKIKALSIVCLWREEDDVDFINALHGNYVRTDDTKQARNEDALFWLAFKNNELEDLMDDFFELREKDKFSGSFAEYAKTLGYWNDEWKE